MKCPKCGNETSKIIDSRYRKIAKHRVRKCTKCGKLFYTREYIVGEERNDWILVSERLPEPMTPVLTCDAYGNIGIASYVGKTTDGVPIWFTEETGHPEWFGMNRAWLPLPKGLKEEEDDD